MYNPELSSYWDLATCGKASDDHNVGWCVNPTDLTGLADEQDLHCQASVTSSLCGSGEAVLKFTKQFEKVDGCPFAFYAQYVCKTLEH